ncbi:MAG: hypothetical protein M4579_003411 [Chaenotheca gracillima]|nr:MAG: hypothetical protein M4579_003411 [Chaenotheca gracillima]
MAQPARVTRSDQLVTSADQLVDSKEQPKENILLPSNPNFAHHFRQLFEPLPQSHYLDQPIEILEVPDSITQDKRYRDHIGLGSESGQHNRSVVECVLDECLKYYKKQLWEAAQNELRQQPREQKIVHRLAAISRGSSGNKSDEQRLNSASLKGVENIDVAASFTRRHTGEVWLMPFNASWAFGYYEEYDEVAAEAVLIGVMAESQNALLKARNQLFIDLGLVHEFRIQAAKPASALGFFTDGNIFHFIGVDKDRGWLEHPKLDVRDPNGLKEIFNIIMTTLRQSLFDPTCNKAIRTERRGSSREVKWVWGKDGCSQSGNDLYGPPDSKLDSDESYESHDSDCSDEEGYVMVGIDVLDDLNIGSD